MLFSCRLLISFDLMHETNSLKEVKIDGPQISVETAYWSYSEQKVQNYSDIDKKKAPHVVRVTDFTYLSLLYDSILQSVTFEART